MRRIRGGGLIDVRAVSFEAGEQLRAVFSIVPLNEDFVHQPFAELRRHRLGQHLQVDKVLHEVPMRGQKSDP